MKNFNNKKSMIVHLRWLNYLHHFQAVAQLLIDNLRPLHLGHIRMTAGGQKQVLHVPVDVWGIQKIT